MSSRDRMHKLACKTGSDNDWKASLDNIKEVKRVIREYFKQEIAENRNNKGSLWNTIRRTLPKKLSQTVNYSRNTAELANEFNDFFISVGQKAAKASEKLAITYGLNNFCSVA